MKKDNKKKVKIAITVLVAALILAVVGVTYAVFNYTGQGSVVNSISTGVMTMTYTEADNKISITNAMPMEDNVGKKLTGTDQVFDFTVETNITGKQSIAYEVTALKADTSTLDNKDVRLYLEKSTDGTTYSEVLAPSAFTPIDSTAPDDTDLYGAKKKEMVLDTGTIQSSVKYYYRLRMWVSKDYEITKDVKTFTVTVNAYGVDATYSKDYKYSISYNLDGGTVTNENPTTYTEDTEDFTLNNPTKEGYIFTGWTGSNGEKTQENVTISKGTVGNKTYKANWVKAYKVTFNGNGGSSTTKVYKENESLGTLPSTSKSGYTFNGWYTELSGGSKITSDTKVTGDTTYYAQWTATTYTKNVSGSNGWSADYTCNNGTGTMTACYYNGTKCDGGYVGDSPFHGCTFSTSGSDSFPYYYCNTSLSSNDVYGGGMSSSISC